MASPVGRGQRGLIVSPPKAGKTTLLKNIAEGITTNAPDIHLMVALIGERPEEVTDMMRSVEGEVFSSTFDEPVEDHTRVAELALARAKRLVEAGARRRHPPGQPHPPDPRLQPRRSHQRQDALRRHRPRRPVPSQALLRRRPERRGRRQPDHTGRMPRRHRQPDGRSDLRGVQGDRQHGGPPRPEALRAPRLPAIDIGRSGTRREELLLDEETLRQVWLLRRMVAMITSSGMDSNDATEKVMERLRKTKSNQEFLATLGKEI